MPLPVRRREQEPEPAMVLDGRLRDGGQDAQVRRASGGGPSTPGDRGRLRVNAARRQYGRPETLRRCQDGCPLRSIDGEQRRIRGEQGKSPPRGQISRCDVGDHRRRRNRDRRRGRRGSHGRDGAGGCHAGRDRRAQTRRWRLDALRARHRPDLVGQGRLPRGVVGRFAPRPGHHRRLLARPLPSVRPQRRGDPWRGPLDYWARTGWS